MSAASYSVLITALLTVIVSAMPVLLAAAGETVGQQSGMLGLGAEGLLLLGAYASFATVVTTGNFWLGFVAGALAGALGSLISVLLSVILGANQIVVGIGITLAGTGVTSMLYEAQFADTRPRLDAMDAWQIPGLSDIPVLGKVLFQQPAVFAVGIALVIGVSLWLHRTAPGLRLRAAGQRPASLDAIGGSVQRTRSGAVLFTGAMVGFGGAYLALLSAGTFTPGMTHGLGYIALVIAMLGRGRLGLVCLIALVYGVCVAGGTALQLTEFSVPSDVISIVPFIAVMIVLTFLTKTLTLPPALAAPYVRGAR